MAEEKVPEKSQVKRVFDDPDESERVGQFSDYVNIVGTDEHVVLTFYQTVISGRDSTRAHSRIVSRVALGMEHAERFASMMVRQIADKSE